MPADLTPSTAPVSCTAMPDPTNTTAFTAMTTAAAPTVEEVLHGLAYCYKEAGTGIRTYFWRTGPAILQVQEGELRQALEQAYDPTMPNWPALVEIADA